VLAYFFIDGLKYGGAADSATIWLPVLAVPIGVLATAWMLHAKGRSRSASLLLAALAIPPLLYILFFGLLLAFNPGWQ
jgi:uncharacterized membrane protein SpoIIM required for sporulation